MWRDYRAWAGEPKKGILWDTYLIFIFYRFGKIGSATVLLLSLFFTDIFQISKSDI